MRDQPHDSGVSLVEVLIAVSIMGSAAVMYASGWNIHRAQNEAAREIELATDIYLRQVEQIKRHDPKDRADSPFNEPAFQLGKACPPDRPDRPPAFYNGSGMTFYRYVGPYRGQSFTTEQLHPAVPRNQLLSDGINGRPPQNAFRILPTNDVPGNPWLAPLPVEYTNPIAAGGLGYSVSVCAARIHNFTGTPPTLAILNGDGLAGVAASSYEHQMIKYAVYVDRDTGAGPRNILTHEFIMEVR